MPAAQNVAIIGAGIAGLACARRLSNAGLSLVVFDKGRGVGGRLATRRAAGGRQFDHGAQYITAQSDAFAATLYDARIKGAIAQWDDGSCKPRYVGVPGMSGFAKHLATGLEIKQRVSVIGIKEGAHGWLVETNCGKCVFDRVISTVPAPQTVALLGSPYDINSQLSQVEFEPCLALMVSLRPGFTRPFLHVSDRDSALSWIAQDSTKPGRPDPSCWVAQANSDWSAQHLELNLDEIKERMLELFCPRLGISREQIDCVVVHRWRYARVAEPLGRDFVCNSTKTFYAGGDWCLGQRVEDAWTSGDAIAWDLLDTL